MIIESLLVVTKDALFTIRIDPIMSLKKKKIVPMFLKKWVGKSVGVVFKKNDAKEPKK